MMRRATFAFVLIFASWATAAGADLHVVADPLPGFYTESQTVSLEVPSGVQAEYRFLEDVDGGYLPWKSPLLFSALPGETRTYTLRLLTTLNNGESLTKDYRYTVSRATPTRPHVKPAPGYSTRPVVIDAQLPPGMTASLQGQTVTFPLSLEGALGELRTYRIEVSGPRGADDGETWVYAVDRRGQGAVGLEVLSPVPGDWANPQWLVLSQQGVDSVSWSWGDTWTAEKSTLYTGPVRLEVKGDGVITVRAVAKGSATENIRTVRWSQGSQSLSAWGVPESGVTSSALSIPVVPGVETSLDDGRTWRPMSAERTESLVDQSLKVVSVQYRKSDGGRPARALYWMDARSPVVPQVEFWGGWNPLLTVVGSTDALFSVDWVLSSGKPLASEPLWGPSAAWKVPDGAVGARVSSRSPSGRITRSSDTVFPEVGWIRPEWTAWESGGGQVSPRSGFRAVYEVRSDRDVPEPSGDSPTLTGPFLPSVPLGVDRTFFVRFAWRDASGVVGPSTSVIAVRIDHLAPQPPRVTFSRRLVKIEPVDLEPGARIFYAMTGTKLTAQESPVWKPYTGTIDLDLLSSGTTPSWLQALVVDAAGNPGAPRLNFPLGTGSAAYEWKGLAFQDPLRGLTGSLSDGAVVPAVKILVQPLWDGDVTGIWTFTSASAALPSDWEKSMVLFDKPIQFTGVPGERRTFSTWWNLRNSTGWIWEKPRLITFVMEQGPPANPVVKGLEAPLIRAQPWSVTAAASQTGDRLTYSLTTDGSEPSDPTGSRAIEWPGTLSWDTPEGTRSEVRLRLAVTSAAGLSREVPWGKKVVIDRTVPAALAPTKDPFRTYRSPASVAFGPFPSQVRYTVTQDGSLPPIPSSDSPILQGPTLEFPGAVGQQVLYRIRLRPFSDALQPGPVTDAIAILVDLTQSVGATGKTSGPGDGLNVVGFPDNGLSSRPVSLTISSPWGTPRFELSEGTVLPKPVESTSPPVPAGLVLPGAEGADRLYTLTVRSYSEEGDPLTPEAKWTLRIDRSAPLAPKVTVLPEPRRPEAVPSVDTSGLRDDEHLYYRWSWTSYPLGSGAIDWTPATKEVPRFPAPDGLLTNFVFEAQVRDDAGNLGPISQESVILDRNVVYASTQANGQGTGTRLDPAGNLAVALAKMRQEGRKILLLTSGTYTLSEAQDWTGFQIWGGLKAGAWEATPTPGRSTIAPAAGKKLAHLIEVYGSLALRRIDFSDAGEPLKNLVLAEGANISVEDSSWLTKSTIVAWQQKGGSLGLRSASAQWGGAQDGSILAVEGVSLRLQDIRWTVQNATNARALVLLRSQSVVSGFTFSSLAGHGLETVLWAREGELTANDLKISSGEGYTSSTALVLDNSVATLINVDVAQSASQGNTGLQVTGGQLDLQKWKLTIAKGNEYNLGLRFQNTDAKVQGGFLQIDSGSYQGGLTQNGGKLALAATRVSLAGGGQWAWGLQTLGSCAVEMSNVSWILEKKTPGQPVLAQQQWTSGSFNLDSRVTGW